MNDKMNIKLPIHRNVHANVHFEAYKGLLLPQTVDITGGGSVGAVLNFGTADGEKQAVQI
jgi:hypothetical protein